MRKRVIALFAVLLVSTVASAGIITISVTNDKNSTYNERATKDTSIVSQAESSKTNSESRLCSKSPASLTGKQSRKWRRPKASTKSSRAARDSTDVEKLTPETKQDYYHKMLNAVNK